MYIIIIIVPLPSKVWMGCKLIKNCMFGWWLGNVAKLFILEFSIFLKYRETWSEISNFSWNHVGTSKETVLIYFCVFMLYRARSVCKKRCAEKCIHLGISGRAHILQRGMRKRGESQRGGWKIYVYVPIQGQSDVVRVHNFMVSI